MSKKSEVMIAEYIKSGEKIKAEYLGVEFEHFLVDNKSLRSYNYFEKNGQKELSLHLVSKGWKVDYEENGNILALSKDGNAVSFEPGGQVEISVRPISSVVEVQNEYNLIKNEIESGLNESQSLVSLGYHPLSKIDDLEMLPKERYDFMYDYLHKQGNMARNMMKGTASTQVSIDYVSEDDFIVKYRVANFLSPFIARIFDCSPIFEGDIYNESNLRIKIWENTDIKRSKMPEGVLDTDFGYESYSKYIMNSAPIIMPENDTFVFKGDKTLKELTKEKDFSMNELEHAMSMVFPDVRVKNFIEIRVADALPNPYSIAVPAFVKGIFYNSSNLLKYYDYSKKFTDLDFTNLNRQMKESYDFDFTCSSDEVLNCKEFVFELIKDAELGLCDDEKTTLSELRKIIEKEGSYSNYLKRLFVEDNDRFREKII